MKDKLVTVSKTMRLRQDLVQKIERMAEQENRNFTNMVETALIERFA